MIKYTSYRGKNAVLIPKLIFLVLDPHEKAVPCEVRWVYQTISTSFLFSETGKKKIPNKKKNRLKISKNKNYNVLIL